MVLPLVMMELLWSNLDAGANIECITYIVSTIVVLIKNVCIAVSQKKLGININAAIDDWLSAKDNKETKKIMKKHAIKARVLTFSLLYSLCVCLFLYIFIVVFVNLKQVSFTDTVDGKI